MQMPYPLLQAILMPMFAVPIVALAGRRIGKKAGWISGLILTYTTLLLCLVGLDVYNGPVYEEYVWAPLVKLKFGLLADGLSLPVAVIMNLLCAACAVYSIDYMEHRVRIEYKEERKGLHALYHTIFLLFSVGLVGIALSTNLIELYLFIELTLIPSYLMIHLFGYIDRERIALMYFLWNHVGAALFFIGVLLTFIQVGSFEIEAMSALARTPLAFWVCLLILVGWLIKMATFGFHVWLPWAHGEHPTSIAAIIATIVGLGNYVIARLLIGQLFEVFKLFSVPLMILALVTMVYGAFLTLAQDDVKRLYACSTISQTAYSLLGLASCTALGITGGIFYFLSHSIGKCILFSVAGILLSQTEIRDMKKMGGLAYKMPVTATLCILGSLILSAVPPLAGFMAEWIMYSGIFLQGIHSGFSIFLIAILSIIATIFTVGYTFWPVRRIFFGSLPKDLKDVKEAPLTMTVPLLILALISILLGVYPNLVMDFLTPWVEGLHLG